MSTNSFTVWELIFPNILKLWQAISQCPPGDPCDKLYSRWQVMFQEILVTIYIPGDSGDKLYSRWSWVLSVTTYLKLSSHMEGRCLGKSKEEQYIV